jgi:hypothetical protein
MLAHSVPVLEVILKALFQASLKMILQKSAALASQMTSIERVKPFFDMARNALSRAARAARKWCKLLQARASLLVKGLEKLSPSLAWPSVQLLNIRAYP